MELSELDELTLSLHPNLKLKKRRISKLSDFKLNVFKIISLRRKTVYLKKELSFKNNGSSDLGV